MKIDPRIPEICDYDCPFADFPPADTAGICRTMSAVWCKKLKELTNKNAACVYRARSAARKTATRSTAARKKTASSKGRKKAPGTRRSTAKRTRR
jgi:hypothetical protein